MKINLKKLKDKIVKAIIKEQTVNHCSKCHGCKLQSFCASVLIAKYSDK